ncbi:MAG: hypothetical protein ACREGJ_00115 [Candidatus Saccharimonadales bacterium]
MFKKADWLAIAKDRTAIILLIVLGIGTIAILITTAARLHISDVQVPVRYTGYGVTNLYRDKWYSLLTFSGFAVLIATLNTLIALKVYQLRRFMGLGLLALSIFLVIVGFIVTNAIFNLAPSV